MKISKLYTLRHPMKTNPMYLFVYIIFGKSIQIDVVWTSTHRLLTNLIWYLAYIVATLISQSNSNILFVSQQPLHLITLNDISWDNISSTSRVFSSWIHSLNGKWCNVNEYLVVFALLCTDILAQHNVVIIPFWNKRWLMYF